MRSEISTSKMKILLLGSTGLVGTAIEDVCNNQDIKCVGITHKQLEITDIDNLRNTLNMYSPSIVINTVAMVGIDLCELEPQKAFDVNSIAVLNLAKICERNNIILVQISSSSVFDGQKKAAYIEKDRPNPTGVYSGSKYIAEYFVKNICKKHYIIRLPTLFGTRKNRGLRFVDKVIQTLKNDAEVKATINRIDSPTYTIDMANKLISLIKTGSYGLYHISNSGITSYYNFTKKLSELLESNSKILKIKEEDLESIAIKPLRLALSSIKLEPLRPWEEALTDFITKDLK